MLTKKEKTVIKKQFEQVMDDRDNFFKLLSAFKKKHGFIPEEYQKDHRVMSALAEYEIMGGWRENLQSKIIVKMAIKKAIKNGKPLEDRDPHVLRHKAFTSLEEEKKKESQTNRINKKVEAAKIKLDKVKKKAKRQELTKNQLRNLRKKLRK